MTQPISTCTYTLLKDKRILPYNTKLGGVDLFIILEPRSPPSSTLILVILSINQNSIELEVSTLALSTLGYETQY